MPRTNRSKISQSSVNWGLRGYQADFLGSDFEPIEIPGFTPKLQQELLNGGQVFKYPNYSLVMNGLSEKRSAVVVCLNIDQNGYPSEKPGGKKYWDTDDDVGLNGANQLGNSYYKMVKEEEVGEGEANTSWEDYDRGHLTPRWAATWGPGGDVNKARFSEEHTYWFPNAALQKGALNGGQEWRGLEEWIRNLSNVRNGKISTFTGPIYGSLNRAVIPAGEKPALVPSGFFKVVCFVRNNSNTGAPQLHVYSFVRFQDAESLKLYKTNPKYTSKNWKQRVQNLQDYQTPLSTIEDMTDLVFPQFMKDANGLRHHTPSPDLNVGDNELPEIIEVSRDEDIIPPENAERRPREPIIRESGIRILAAMVDPHGNDRDREWVMLVNLGQADINLDGWTLSDNSDRLLRLPARVLSPGHSLRVDKLYPELQLSNQQDVIKLYNAQKQRVDRAKYTHSDVERGSPVIFTVSRL